MVLAAQIDNGSIETRKLFALAKERVVEVEVGTRCGQVKPG